MSQYMNTIARCDGCHSSPQEDPGTRIVLSYQPETKLQMLDLCFDCVMAGSWICPNCDEVHESGPCPGEHTP